MWSSSVPAAVDALVASLRAADLGGATVLDGPTVTAAAIMEAITVGYEDESTSAVVDAVATAEGLSRATDRESYTITCAVEVLAGSSTDLPATRRRAYELLGLVGRILAADPRLGSAVMQARLGQHTLSQAQEGQGAVARIVFGVECDAFSVR